jgi:hypothetical protein
MAYAEGSYRNLFFTNKVYDERITNLSELSGYAQSDSEDLRVKQP